MTDDLNKPADCGDPTCTREHPPQRVLELAAVALRYARAGERAHSYGPVVAILAGWGVDGVRIATSLWVEALVRGTGLATLDPDRLTELRFASTHDGVVDSGTPTVGADGVPPGVRWAGRYLLAWAKGDDDQIDALGASIEHDPAVLSQSVLSLLDTCGLGLANPDALLRAARGEG